MRRGNPTGVNVARWVEWEEERRRLTLEALEDVDAGRVIDHPSVQAWADSLSGEAPARPHRRRSRGVIPTSAEDGSR